MRLSVAIAIVLGATSCRQILNIDPGVVRDDGAVDDASPVDSPSDTPIDMAFNRWTNLAIVPGLQPGDQDPTLTGDMLEIYFTRGNGVYFATRTSLTVAWSTPSPITWIGPASDDRAPEMSPEGLFLQFASDRGAGTTLDIYLTFRTSRMANWETPDPLSTLNDANFDERTGSATTTGARVTLSSDRDGQKLDLYEANRPGMLGTPYDAPIRIPVSTAGDDGSPFLSGDGLTLYYASAAPNSTQRDLYVSTRAALSDQFTLGMRIDELSTPFNDSDPWVSPDGLDIYFLSDRDGSPRIWHASRASR